MNALRRRTFLEVNPWLACATVLYLASKVDESSARISEIIEALNKPNPSALPDAKTPPPSFVTEDLVLECEFHMLETLRHNLVVFHPYRPLQQCVGPRRRVLCPLPLCDRV